MVNRQARPAAGEAPVGQQRVGLAQTLGLDVAAEAEHRVLAGAALGAFQAHDHHIACLELADQTVLHRIILSRVHLERALEHQQVLDGVVEPPTAISIVIAF